MKKICVYCGSSSGKGDAYLVAADKLADALVSRGLELVYGGASIGIDIARWWRPNAANYFDRVSKAVILDALSEVGGPDLVARFAASKKSELAEGAERVFSGNFITDAAVRDAALAWVPDAMRFAGQEATVADEEANEASDASDEVAGEDDKSPREMAA